MHAPNQAYRESQARDQGHGPDERCGAQPKKPEWQRYSQSPRGVSHQLDRALYTKTGVVLDAPDRIRIIRIGAVHQLLSRRPIDDKIPGAATPVGDQQYGKEDHGKCKRESTDAHNEQIREIVPCTGCRDLRFAGHSANSTSGKKANFFHEAKSFQGTALEPRPKRE